MNKNQIKFLKYLSSMDNSIELNRVWNDFLDLVVLELTLPFHFANDEKEKEYQNIRKKYNENEKGFQEAFELLIQSLEENPKQDFLGGIYMECFKPKTQTDITFTPYQTAQVLAGLSINEKACKSIIEKKSI